MVNGAAKKKGEQRVGPFVLVDELPGGGSARVFRSMYAPEVRDPSVPLAPGDHAVIKVLRDTAARDASVSSMFSREAELLSMVEHPNLVKGVTRGVTAGRVWSAVEYIEGENLSTVFFMMRQERLRLRPELVVSLAADILSGLAAAQSIIDHRGRSLGLIHRDMSPRNVMIDIKGTAKVIDFGHALLSLREEPSTEIVGTPGYLAPEQAKRDQLTQGVDVYQVGLLMFEMLTGDRAFPVDSATDEALLRVHADNKRAPWPRNLDVPIELKAMVEQALGPTPEDRPADAAAFYALVESLVSDPEEARHRLSVVIKDLVRSNPEKPDPLYV
ncbi:MAG TPA: serine/threonine-protein kinase [Myxococcota bacterium]|jgi:serine/threonine-protein kinase